MELIIQPKGSFLCGQTCVAMLAGVSLEVSIAAFGTRYRTSTGQVVRALRKLGVSCGEALISVKKQQKAPICMVKQHFKGSKNTHWIIWAGDVYYDPVWGIVEYGYEDEAYETSFLPIFSVPEVV